jgi:hypothetical protein
MASEPKRISVDPNSELGRLLDEASRSPLLVEKDGVTYHVTAKQIRRSGDYDPREAIAAMRAAAGSWSDIDPEALKKQLYRAREEGTSPRSPYDVSGR